jgi:2-polyprenyl-6-hydroxyphenyl methylase/3-demethylubiquinone-9 3-methyltransferase
MPPPIWPAGKAGDVLTVGFTIAGSAFLALNGGAGPAFTDAISFQLVTEDQAQTDRYWNAITKAGGAEIACSWCRDRFGVRWQIVPRALIQGMADPDPAAAARVMQAMMGMVKIEIAAIEAARRGASALATNSPSATSSTLRSLWSGARGASIWRNGGAPSPGAPSSTRWSCTQAAISRRR